MPSVGVCVSDGCSDKFPLILWLKTTQTYLIVLEVRSPSGVPWTKIGMSVGPFPSGGSRGESLPWPFPASRGRLPFPACGGSTLASAPVAASPPLPPALLPPSRKDLGMTQGHMDHSGASSHLKALNLVTPTRPFVQVRSCIQRSQDQDEDIWGAYSGPALI